MKILLDEQLSSDLVLYFPSSFQVFMPRELGWSGLQNGNLREKLNERNFQFLISADKNMPFQQNFNKMNYSVILLDTPTMDPEHQILFAGKLTKFLSNLPNPLPQLVWVNIEGFAAIDKIQAIQKILPIDQILFI